MIRNVIEYLLESAHKYPDKIAVIDENRKLTFAELEREAKKVSSAILEACGPIKNQPIVVYMEKGVDCLVAFWEPYTAAIFTARLIRKCRRSVSNEFWMCCALNLLSMGKSN